MSAHKNSHFWLNFFIVIAQIISLSQQSDIHSFLAYLAQTKDHTSASEIIFHGRNECDVLIQTYFFPQRKSRFNTVGRFLSDQFWPNTRIYIHQHITFDSFKQNAYLGKNPIPFDNVPCVNLLSRKKSWRLFLERLKIKLYEAYRFCW